MSAATFGLVFGGNVRRRREERGWDCTELAARVGVHRTMIARIERGQREPSLGIALALADVLGVSVQELAAPESCRRSAKSHKREAPKKVGQRENA